MNSPANETAGPRYFIVAGEDSGDIHAAHLMRAMRARAPGVAFRGFGGKRMQAEGLDCLEDLPARAIMGLFPVLAALPRIRGWFKKAEQALREAPPDALILVDYPGFNLRLAARAHAMGIRVVYYISPQVWAWHRSRIAKIAKLVDLMLVILPFEVEAYAGTDLDVRYVGHPLVDHLETVEYDDALAAELGAAPAEVTIGLLPGSRRHVFDALWPVYARAARELVESHGFGGARFLVAAANEELAARVRDDANVAGLDLRVVEGKPYDVMRLADVCITASGTTTLEIAAHETPFVLCYRVSPVLYGIGRLVVRVPHIGLVNLIAGRGIVPEHVGMRSFHRALAADVADLIRNGARREKMVQDLREVRAKLQTPGSYDRAAKAVLG